MKLPFCVGLLVIGCLVACAQQSHAELIYDLRFATTAAHPDPKTVQLTASDVNTSLTLQLWGVVSAGSDGIFNGNDTLVSGFANIYSNNQASNGALTAGSGIVASAFPNTAGFKVNNSILGVSGNLFVDSDHSAGTPNVADGILDWGADQVFTVGGLANGAQNLYVHGGVVSNELQSYSFSFGGPTPIVAGIAATGSQLSATDPQRWEVLLGTFTLQINGINSSGTTTFDPFISSLVRLPGPGVTTANGMNYFQDGVNQGEFALSASQFTGVTLVTAVPEPATSLVALAAIVMLVLVCRMQRLPQQAC